MKSMKAICAIAMLCAGIPAVAHAGEFESLTGLEFGAGYFGEDPHRGGVLLTERFRYLPEIPLTLEINSYLPYGLGASLLLDVYRGQNLRLHGNLGVFKPFSADLNISRTDISRSCDMTVGAGLEWRDDKSGMSILFDWRAYLPNPTDVPLRYGNFSGQIYVDALKGGQIWLGIGWPL